MTVLNDSDFIVLWHRMLKTMIQYPSESWYSCPNPFILSVSTSKDFCPLLLSRGLSSNPRHPHRKPCSVLLPIMRPNPNIEWVIIVTKSDGFNLLLFVNISIFFPLVKSHFKFKWALSILFPCYDADNSFFHSKSNN